MSPKYPPHTRAVRQLTKVLNRGLADDYAVSVHDPIAVKGWTGKYAPEIDVAVIAERTYTNTPTQADSFAFVEVSDNPFKEDREVYIPLYVAAGVPTWHVNIPDRQVEFYQAGSVANDPPTQIFAEGESFKILDVSTRAADLFAPK